MKRDLNKYWLQINRSHRDLKWMSYDNWTPEIQKSIDESVAKMKILLDLMTKEVENEQK